MHVCGLGQEAGHVASAKPALVQGRAGSECARGRHQSTAPCADLIRSVCDISPAHFAHVPDRDPKGQDPKGLGAPKRVEQVAQRATPIKLVYVTIRFYR
jgi:hypothetical protein